MQGKSKLGVVLAIGLLGFGSTAHAIMSNPYGWYLEGNAGITKIFDINLNGGSLSNKKNYGFNIDLGYKFMPYFALEIGYTRYGEANIKDQFGTTAYNLQSYSYDLSVKPIMPVYDSGMEFFTKLGVQRGHSKFSIQDLTAATILGLQGGSSSHTGLYIALGGQYYFMPELAGVLQWARAQGNKNVGTLDLYSLGVNFNFG